MENNCTCGSPFSSGYPLIRKRVNTDLFLVFELREGDKGVDLSKYKNLSVSIVKENSLVANSRAENVTINGSRIAVQINASDNKRVG